MVVAIRRRHVQGTLKGTAVKGKTIKLSESVVMDSHSILVWTVGQ